MDDNLQINVNEVNNKIIDEIFPLLIEIDEEYNDIPEDDQPAVFYAMFRCAATALFYQGWTQDELVDSILEEHTLFLENDTNIPKNIQ